MLVNQSQTLNRNQQTSFSRDGFINNFNVASFNSRHACAWDWHLSLVLSSHIFVVSSLQLAFTQLPLLTNNGVDMLLIKSWILYIMVAPQLSRHWSMADDLSWGHHSTPGTDVCHAWDWSSPSAHQYHSTETVRAPHWHCYHNLGKLDIVWVPEVKTLDERTIIARNGPELMWSLPGSTPWLWSAGQLEASIQVTWSPSTNQSSTPWLWSAHRHFIVESDGGILTLLMASTDEYLDAGWKQKRFGPRTGSRCLFTQPLFFLTAGCVADRLTVFIISPKSRFAFSQC